MKNKTVNGIFDNGDVMSDIKLKLDELKRVQDKKAASKYQKTLLCLKTDV